MTAQSPSGPAVPPAVLLARTLVLAAIGHGLTDAVLSPGSRNAPLSLALHAADAAGLLRLHVRVDERSAGFLALGLGRASGRPALVSTTSGTAVANLHPAVLEAHHGGVPMIVLSADRPPALRALGANQVIDQRQVFSGALRWFEEPEPPAPHSDPEQWRAMFQHALRASVGALPGPVQLNLPFDVPLLPEAAESEDPDRWLSQVRPGGFEAHPATDAEPVAAPEPGERVLFVADLTHPAAAGVAAAGQLVVSEAGGAAGPRVLEAGIPLLEADFAGDLFAGATPDRVVVLGRPTLYRAVSALLGSAPVIDVVGPTGPVADPTGRARTVSGALAAILGPAPTEFREAWLDADSAVRDVLAEAVAGHDLGLGPLLARTVVASLPTSAMLVLGSSQTPRDVGRFSCCRAGVRVLANRGVAGIDGTVSTAIGAALADPERPTVALLGDLTFLHELNGLLIGPHEPVPDLTFVVSNNDGGAIFGTLEPGAAQYVRPFERVFATPLGVQLGQVVESLGYEHLMVTDPEELAAELTAEALQGTGIRVIEVPTDRSSLREFSATVRGSVDRALRR
ncbi:2-succinyl-5-enolpyruvyl-6-hydroxy-3-cyclohexene-1-carboxylic-acid synthase [Nakamurella sp. A5-74]|uniref:2-succinyl-5-enolpyruvyl-6-hydroxy-3-cyclohexene-1-carboxylate synthase n=1 Tax=Nakamurella sp. A5-74 TaxID=3158264 RepID=A0AAU8DSK0_9ACTN